MKAYLQTFVLAPIVILGLSGIGTAADLGLRHFGARAGLSANPDQFQGGVFVDAGQISLIQFQPRFELGFGNGVRLGAANLDAVYPFSGSSWRF